MHAKWPNDIYGVDEEAGNDLTAGKMDATRLFKLGGVIVHAMSRNMDLLPSDKDSADRPKPQTTYIIGVGINVGCTSQAGASSSLLGVNDLIDRINARDVGSGRPKTEHLLRSQVLCAFAKHLSHYLERFVAEGFGTPDAGPDENHLGRLHKSVLRGGLADIYADLWLNAGQVVDVRHEKEAFTGSETTAKFVLCGLSADGFLIGRRIDADCLDANCSDANGQSKDAGHNFVELHPNENRFDLLLGLIYRPS